MSCFPQLFKFSLTTFCSWGSESKFRNVPLSTCLSGSVYRDSSEGRGREGTANSVLLCEQSADRVTSASFQQRKQQLTYLLLSNCRSVSGSLFCVIGRLLLLGPDGVHVGQAVLHVAAGHLQGEDRGGRHAAVRCRESGWVERNTQYARHYRQDSSVRDGDTAWQNLTWL